MSFSDNSSVYLFTPLTLLVPNHFYNFYIINSCPSLFSLAHTLRSLSFWESIYQSLYPTQFVSTYFRSHTGTLKHSCYIFYWNYFFPRYKCLSPHHVSIPDDEHDCLSDCANICVLLENTLSSVVKTSL